MSNNELGSIIKGYEEGAYHLLLCYQTNQKKTNI